jgi:hypothetical protein
MATAKLATDLYTKPAMNAIGGARWEYRTYSMAAADMVTTNVFALAPFPAGHRLVDAFVECTDIDSATSAAFDVGILNSYFGDAFPTVAKPAAYSVNGLTDTGTVSGLVSGGNLFSAITIGQAGGRARLGMSAASTYTLTPSYSIGVSEYKDRIVALQFTTNPGTAVAGYVTIGLCFERDQEVNT